MQQEIFTIVNDILKTPSTIPAEIPLFPTLKKYLKKELENAEIVYERLYPKSLSIKSKESFLFTQLLSIKELPYFSHLASESTAEINPFIDTEPPPYYSLKNSKDKTLVFESRFECGNLYLALKVNIILIL